MDIDEAMDLVGEFGTVQRLVFWSLAIPQIFLAWNHLLNVFVGAIPEFDCNTVTLKDGKETLTGVRGCSPDPSESPCKSYTFAGNDFTSIASEWDLVCDSAYKTDLAQSIYMVGLLMGNLLGGYLADNHGRKPVCYVGAFGLFFFGVLAITPPSFNQYILIRHMAGLLSGAFGLISFTLPAEMVGSSYRGYVNVVTSITFALGISTLPILAYFVRDWRMLSLISSLPGLVGVAYFFFLPESPRWLLTQGRIKEAEELITNMWARNSSTSRPIPSFLSSSYHPPQHLHGDGTSKDECFNHDETPIPPMAMTLSHNRGLHHQGQHGFTNHLNHCHPGQDQPYHQGCRITLRAPHQSQKKNRQGSLADIFCNINLFKITLNNVFTWFVSNMTYYGLSFKMGDLNGNKYVNVLLAGLVEIPACLLTLYFMDRYGRRVTYVWTLFTSAAVCLSITLLSDVATTLSTVLALLGKTSISMTVCVCWMHAAEMYPTNIRNKAMSLCSMSGRFGGCVAPMILALGRRHYGTDFMVFGSLALLASIVSSKLPETLNRSLPETVDDLDRDLHLNLIGQKSKEVTQLLASEEGSSYHLSHADGGLN